MVIFAVELLPLQVIIQRHTGGFMECDDSKEMIYWEGTFRICYDNLIHFFVM
jgi:hypothetical protein